MNTFLPSSKISPRVIRFLSIGISSNNACTSKALTSIGGEIPCRKLGKPVDKKIKPMKQQKLSFLFYTKKILVAGQNSTYPV